MSISLKYYLKQKKMLDSYLISVFFNYQINEKKSFFYRRENAIAAR